VIVDHHFLRGADYSIMLKELRAEGAHLITGAEFMGREILPLEARREALHRLLPPSSDWYRRFRSREPSVIREIMALDPYERWKELFPQQ